MANRSNPTGIRFDIEKIEFIKQREKLKSNQQVVDFLMNRYWWEHKMPIPTYKEVPPLSLKLEAAFEQPKNQHPVKQRKTPQEWVLEKRELDDHELYKKWFADLEADPYLTSKEKSAIKAA